MKFFAKLVVAAICLIPATVTAVSQSSEVPTTGFTVVSPSKRVYDSRPVGVAAGSATVIDTGHPEAVAASVNVTLTQTVGAGYLTAWDGLSAQPDTSFANWTESGKDIASFTIVPLNQGRFTLYSSGASNVLVDLVGFYTGSTPAPPTTTIAPTTTTVAPSTTTSPSTTQPTTTPPTTTQAPTTTTQPPVAGVQFEEQFTNTDRSYFDSRFDVELVERTFFERPGSPYMGDHNMDCGAPETQRTVHNMSLDQIWLCAPGGDPAKGHVMSSAGNSEYSYTTFSPKGTYTARKVCWRVNLTDSPGGRTWWEVAFIPSDVYDARPTFAYTSPDFPGSDGGNGFPAGAVHVDFTQNNMELWTNGTTRNIRKNFWESGYQDTEFHTTDKATRYLHCITDTAAGLTLTQERPSGTVTWTVAGADLPAEYRVGFKAENYNAGKDGSANQTWHWDSIVLSNP